MTLSQSIALAETIADAIKAAYAVQDYAIADALQVALDLAVARQDAIRATHAAEVTPLSLID